MPNIAPQYRTIVAGSGFRKAVERGRLEFTGADRVTFLQAQVTNDLDSLKTGQGVYAALLTPQGRMVTDLHIHRRPDRVIVDVPISLAPALVSKFDAMVFSEDVQVSDASERQAQIATIGGLAAQVVATSCGISPDSVRSLKLWEQVDFDGGFIARSDAAKVDSFDVIFEAERASVLIAALEAAGSLPLSSELAESIRIDSTRPAFGIDMTEETIPLEAGLLERAISTTKGCYVGQELVIRVLHRGGGRVARRLVKMRFASKPSARNLVADGKNVGQVTSIGESLDDAGWNALGYLHRDYAEVGRHVEL